MSEITVREGITKLRQAMEARGYSPNRILQFNSTTNQLIKFMDATGVSEFSMSTAMSFLEQHYGFKADGTLSRVNQSRLQDLTMLSELQLHGTFVPRCRNGNYHFPAPFQAAAYDFLAYRRFVGIVERNMCTISLYLERFFSYLNGQGVIGISHITGTHIHGFLRFISGFSNQSKNHNMRTVRQFMEFCHKNGCHPENLSSFAPNVHYERRSRLPSAYSYDDVVKLLAQIDRHSPVGKRNYAMALLVARLGLRSGDVVAMRFANIDWESNRISLTQHKTGKPLTLPLLEDVGLAIIDYLKFGRPQSDSDFIFLCHKPPIQELSFRALYRIISGYIGKAGLLVKGKKRGPHALRHSLASRLLEENVPLPVISEILGHANTETTAVYLSISIEQLRRCALEV
jgi:site-specific recombinase XerD